MSLDAEDLVLYLADEDNKLKWLGISFQLEISDQKAKSKYYKRAFDDLINGFNDTHEWIVQPLHSHKLFPWFTESDNQKEIRNLKNVFTGITDFKGYISLSSNDIKKLFPDLFLYSYTTHSQDLFIFNNKHPFAIMLNQHLSIDIIS